jgi:hypoxanthine phosphoribosyltransferase
MTWADYDVAMADLAAKVAEADFAPDIILAIARGGLFPAGSLAYAMSIKNLYVMNMEYYTGVDERREVPVMLPPYLDTNDLSDSKVLVVDDVSDTGHTLQAVEDFCAKHVAEARTAVLYEKPWTEYPCDHVWKHTDRWIVFPWSPLD